MTNPQPGCKQRRIGDLPRMTDTMFATLSRLRDARDDEGYLWLPLADVHHFTLKALLRNDWIIWSKGVAGTEYQITHRGLSALKIYGLPVATRRTDGICPNCNERPVAYSATGNCHGYCWECSREYKKQQRDRHGGSMKLPGKPCPMCNIRPVHTSASGFTHSYCLECKRERAKAERQRKYADRLARIAAGEFIPCCHCKERPIYHLNGVTYDYCYECYQAHQKEYRMRRKWQRKFGTKHQFQKQEGTED